jgi:predicted  nucleic acid-binding Zn-ribbon protein
MTAKKNFSALAKGKPTNQKPTVNKPKVEVIKKEEKVIDTENPTDVTKNMVNEILKNVTHEIEKPEYVEEYIPNTNDLNSLEWLQEQVDLLTQENKSLNDELSEVYGLVNNGNNGETDTQIINEIISLFMELQNNLTGNNPQGQKWTMASIPHLLLNLTTRFPFLDKYKRV